MSNNHLLEHARKCRRKAHRDAVVAVINKPAAVRLDRNASSHPSLAQIGHHPGTVRYVRNAYAVVWFPHVGTREVNIQNLIVCDPAASSR